MSTPFATCTQDQNSNMHSQLGGQDQDALAARILSWGILAVWLKLIVATPYGISFVDTHTQLDKYLHSIHECISKVCKSAPVCCTTMSNPA